MPGNFGAAFGNLISLPEAALRGVGRAVFGPGRRPLHELGAGIKGAFAQRPRSAPDRSRMRRATPQEEAPLMSGRRAASPALSSSAPKPAFGQSPPPTRERTAASASLEMPEISAAASGGWNVSSKTRDELGESKPEARHVSLDFNDADGTPRGVEIVIPQDASPAERAAAQAYVDRTVQWYASHGVKVPNRGVKVQGAVDEYGNRQRGTPGRFHTEPFFVSDQEALGAMQKDPGGYAKILSETLGGIPGVTFHAPHKVNDPGATRGDLNERDFARSTIIPQLERIAKSGAPAPQSPSVSPGVYAQGLKSPAQMILRDGRTGRAIAGAIDIAAGSAIEVLDGSQQGRVHVVVNGKEGYMHPDYFRPQAQAAQTQAASGSTPTTTGRIQKAAGVNPYLIDPIY